MMKEWSAARRRVQEIKKIDMKGGEKFNREMTAVYTYTLLSPSQSPYLSTLYTLLLECMLYKKLILMRFYKPN